MTAIVLSISLTLLPYFVKKNDANSFKSGRKWGESGGKRSGFRKIHLILTFIVRCDEVTDLAVEKTAEQLKAAQRNRFVETKMLERLGTNNAVFHKARTADVLPL